MVVSKRNTSNIYDGCLSYLRENVNATLPKNQHWFESTEFKNIIGTKEIFNVHNEPFDESPAYFEISFGKRYIFPIAYSIQGRRFNSMHLLKGWDFFGKNVYDIWVPLSSFSNSLLKQNVIKTVPLNVNESYKEFKIQMTEPDSTGKWALCLGQIEIFGDIYAKPFFKGNFCNNQLSCQRKKDLMMNILLITCI